MAADKWDALLKDLRSSLHDVAIIVSDDGPDGRLYPFAQADFHPTDEAGTPMSLACLGAIQLLLSYGDGHARWELGWADEDVKFVKDVVRAVCTGNSKEVQGLGRIYVEVSLPDGSTVKTSTYDFPSGLVSRPGWKKRERKG
jgi:subtilisin family serine protease